MNRRSVQVLAMLALMMLSTVTVRSAQVGEESADQDTYRLAQEPPPPPPPPPSSPPPAAAPPPPPHPSQAQHQAPRWARPASTPRPRPRTSSSFYITVPLVQDVDREVVRPGASIEGRIGVILGVLVPEFEIGFQWIPVDLDKLRPGLGRDPLKLFFFGLGLRLQIPTDSRVQPYVSGAFNFNWWNFRQESLACNFWYCTAVDRYSFTPGFSGRAGIAIDVDRGVAIDLGVKLAMSFEGDFFSENQFWVAPMFGFTVYR